MDAAWHDLRALQPFCHANSVNWFPDIHAEGRAEVHFALGLAGEVGELVNLIKKRHRGDQVNDQDVAFEAADCLIYLLDLCEELGVDLTQAVRLKHAVLVERWG